MMALELELQNPDQLPDVPALSDFQRWAEAALVDWQAACSLVVRVVDADESHRLNARYRRQDKPTNVLSFPLELPEEVLGQLSERPLGDLVICAPLVSDEAREQDKPVDRHWAHLTVHGVLHLLGHDHQEAGEAAVMEAMEVRILAALGMPDPYRDNTNPADSAEIAS